VRLVIYNHRIRDHVLGERIGLVLGILPQWHSFLGESDIDAVKDIDRILIAGPQLRRTGDVMAVLQYNVEKAKVLDAVDQLVKRSPGGRWLETPFPMAFAQADRADRLFALPRERIAVVAPVGLEKQLVQIGPKVNIPNSKGDEALVAFIKTPWRVFIGRDFDLPKSIAWMRLRVIPNADGGVVLEVEAEDESAELAKQNAELVARRINSMAQMGGLGAFLAGFGLEPFVDHVTLTTNEKKIEGKLVVRPKQLKRILNTVEVWIEAQTGRRLARAPARPETGEGGAASGRGDESSSGAASTARGGAPPKPALPKAEPSDSPGTAGEGTR
jgi:hypothetical protein